MVYDFSKIHKQYIHLQGFSLYPSFLSYLFSLSLPDLTLLFLVPPTAAPRQERGKTGTAKNPA
jgi:hypothetical protein